ncbi:MAG: PTS sugar transporter subunit IIC [Lactobacillaceae bacterium]|nr:PTS sugar transporter subunit IIC [Lactobacillaceae bacterium]
MTAKDWVFSVSQGISNVILAVLGMGLLMGSIGNAMINYGHWDMLGQALVDSGNIGQKLLAPALGVGIAYMLRTNILTMGAAMIAATVGSNSIYFADSAITAAHTATGWDAGAAQLAQGSLIQTAGQPVSAVLAGLVAALIGKVLTGKTPLDMLLVPLAAATGGSIFGLGAAAVTTPFLNWISESLADTMGVNPMLGAAVVSVAWFTFLMTPASSAALAIAVMLDPLSAGAALIGTASGFIMYTAMGWAQNNWGARMATLLGTPKIQFPNLLKNPVLYVGPAVIAGASAVVAVGMFGFKAPYAIAGLGLNGFIAPLALLSTDVGGFVLLMLFGVLIPTVASVAFYLVLRKANVIKHDDLHLDVV